MRLTECDDGREKGNCVEVIRNDFLLPSPAEADWSCPKDRNQKEIQEAIKLSEQNIKQEKRESMET